MAAWDIAGSAGVWKTAGMGGIAGLDWIAVRALHAAGAPAGWPDLVAALRMIEAGALRGAARKAEQEKPRGGGSDG